MPTTRFHRLAVLLLLPWLLGGCAVYDHFFHPHRLGTPPVTAKTKAKMKAAADARHKGLTLGGPATTDGSAKAVKTDEAAGADGASVPAPAAKADAKDNTTTYNELADNIRNTYDKDGHLKRSVVQRFQNNDHALHHYAMSAPQRTEANRDARKMRKHPKGKGKAAPKSQGTEATDAAAAPEPDPTQPTAVPAAKAPKATGAAKAPARPAPRVTPKPRPAAKPQPRPTAEPTPAAADEPATEDRATKKEKPTKEKKPKRDKNGNKLPKADPTQPHD